MNQKFLCIGHTSYDISLPVPSFPVENTKYRITNQVRCGGGPAANGAAVLGKWGMDTTFIGTVGYDSFGNAIKKEFEELRVNTKFLETNYENSTTTSFIIINEQTGSRTLFNCAQEYTQIKKLKIDFAPHVILVDGHDYEISKEALQKYPNAISVIDAGRITKELLDLCKYVKHIVCSKGFAETVTNKKFDFTNPKTIADIYYDLKSRYPNSNIVVTLEEHGALYEFNNSIKIMPAIKVPIKDTTGAGDIFHGAFTYAIANGYNMEETVKISNITAGLSCRVVGARTGIPDLAEVLDYYEKHQ